MKVIRKFAHCFWTLWTLKCVGYTVFLFLALILSIWPTIKANNLRKCYSQILKRLKVLRCWSSPIKSILFVCPYVCLFLHLWCIFLKIYSVGFLNFFAWGNFAIYTKKWQSHSLENIICWLVTWVNETNFDQNWNIWDFNEGNITVCALNDPA